jgi:transcription antitermination factor NusG
VRTDLAWFALAVRSRHEFVARDELVRKGIETFLPTVFKLQQWRDRKKQVEFAVFPGYCFVHVPARADEFLHVLKTRGTVSLVSLVPGHPTPVPHEEIDALRTVTASGRAFDVYPGYTLGTRVRIRRGPLRGAEGVLGIRESLQMFFVNIEILGRSVGLKVLADDLELL